MPKKILIADDEPNILKMLASRLKANNYDVIAAFDGVSAVAKAHKEKPDLIILDIKMPAGSGMTVYENLQKAPETSMIPIIFITAYPSKEVEQKARQMGAVDFISKPFDPAQLIAKVKKAMGEE